MLVSLLFSPLYNLVFGSTSVLQRTFAQSHIKLQYLFETNGFTMRSAGVTRNCLMTEMKSSCSLMTVSARAVGSKLEPPRQAERRKSLLEYSRL
jgi:hypothetical protein